MLITFLIVMTAGAILGGIELASGEATVQKVGHISADGTPVRYSMCVFAYLFFCAALAVGWFVAIFEWRNPEGERWKPEFDDPSKRSGL